MPAALTFLLGHWRTIGVGLIATAVGAYIMTLRIQRDHYRAEFENEQAAFVFFKAEVAAIGKAQKERAAAIAAHDELLKEEADHDHTVAVGKLHADIERVRHERDSARRSFLSAVPAGSRCPDGQTCFDRAEYLDAYRDLVSEVRGPADEGSEIAVDMQTAQRWARGR